MRIPRSPHSSYRARCIGMIRLCWPAIVRRSDALAHGNAVVRLKTNGSIEIKYTSVFARYLQFDRFQTTGPAKILDPRKNGLADSFSAVGRFDIEVSESCLT